MCNLKKIFWWLLMFDIPLLVANAFMGAPVRPSCALLRLSGIFFLVSFGYEDPQRQKRLDDHILWIQRCGAGRLNILPSGERPCGWPDIITQAQ